MEIKLDDFYTIRLEPLLRILVAAAHRMRRTLITLTRQLITSKKYYFTHITKNTSGGGVITNYLQQA